MKMPKGMKMPKPTAKKATPATKKPGKKASKKK